MACFSPFFPFLLGLILTGCGSDPAVELVQTQTSMPTQLPLMSTATPTPTLIGALSPDTKEPPSKLTGELEIRFPHPFGDQPEFCETFVPYQLTLK